MEKLSLGNWIRRVISKKNNPLVMIRDVHRPNPEYWDKYIYEFKNSKYVPPYLDKNNVYTDEVIARSKCIYTQRNINAINAYYSSTNNFGEIHKLLVESFKLVNEGWINNWGKVKMGKIQIVYNFYNLSYYDELLGLLSLGYLFDIDDYTFKLIVDVNDRDKVKDELFEFIIRAKFPERLPIESESYDKYFIVPKAFDSLRKAIKESDKKQASQLVSKFVRSEWYNNHKSCGWSGTHRRENGVYSGYWCWEAAAVTCIMDLDDSSYRNWKYYPKDVVDYFRSQRKA